MPATLCCAWGGEQGPGPLRGDGGPVAQGSLLSPHWDKSGCYWLWFPFCRWELEAQSCWCAQPEAQGMAP